MRNICLMMWILLFSSLTSQLLLLRTFTCSTQGLVCSKQGKFTSADFCSTSKVKESEINKVKPKHRRQKVLCNKNVLLKRYRKDFEFNWCRIHQAKLDWKKYLAPCAKHTKWGVSLAGWKNKKSRTFAANSFISKWDIRPAGEFSRFFIRSRTSSNYTKNVGGDSWRIHIKGASSVSATVFDHNNGIYEVLFLLMEAGLYQIEISLDYTLCDGFKDPPVDWYRKGMYTVHQFLIFR